MRLAVLCLATVDAAWSEYGAWSDCSVTCGDGIRERVRQCVYPEAACWSGVDCDGPATAVVSCSVAAGKYTVQPSKRAFWQHALSFGFRK